MEAKGEMNNNDVGVSSNNFVLTTRGSIQRDIAIFCPSVSPLVLWTVGAWQRQAPWYSETNRQRGGDSCREVL